MQWDPDISKTGDESIMLKNINPIDPATPIFSILSGAISIRVCFRLGDRDATAANDNAVTGAGFQAYIVNTIFTPRNKVASTAS